MLSGFRLTPNLEGQSTVFITPGAGWPIYTPRHQVPILVAFCDLHGLQWDYYFPGHHTGSWDVILARKVTVLCRTRLVKYISIQCSLIFERAWFLEASRASSVFPSHKSNLHVKESR